MGRVKKGIWYFFKETDKFLFILCVITSIFGLLMVHSATICNIREGAIISRDLRVMIIAVVLGFILAILISLIDFEFILKLWPFIGGVCLLLMCALFIWGVGPASRPDAKTWISFGGTYFQPSELVKIGFIITFGSHLDLVKDKLNSFLHIALLAVHAIVPIALVMVSGDDGSALVFIIIAIGMMFMAGLHWAYFVAGGLIIGAAVPLFWLKLNEFQRTRFLAVIRPDLYPTEAYQQTQGLNAIGSGGFFGKGLFKGTYTQNGIVPESENDMIFTVVGEELGFVGCFIALLLLALIVYRIIRVGKRSGNHPAFLMCYGMAFMIAAQVIINIGMCLRILPVIGITLPFFSAGGSSSLCIYIGLGLIFSIYRSTQIRKPVDFRLSRINTPFSEV